VQTLQKQILIFRMRIFSPAPAELAGAIIATLNLNLSQMDWTWLADLSLRKATKFSIDSAKKYWGKTF